MGGKAPDAEVRAIRLLQILELLEDGPLRAMDLAEQLHVSQRTIERDLRLLQRSRLRRRVALGPSWLWYLVEAGD